jgi:hypothetical protein
LVVERLSPAHCDEICRLHRDPEVMKTLSADGNILADEVTREGLRQADEHWGAARVRAMGLPGQGGWAVISSQTMPIPTTGYSMIETERSSPHFRHDRSQPVRCTRSVYNAG